MENTSVMLLCGKMCETTCHVECIMVSWIKTLFRTIFNESDILKSIRKRGFIIMSRQRKRFNAKFKYRPCNCSCFADYQPRRLPAPYSAPPYDLNSGQPRTRLPDGRLSRSLLMSPALLQFQIQDRISHQEADCNKRYNLNNFSLAYLLCPPLWVILTQ